MLNKVPEVTVYFWIIKILCTTVGESFADYINETLGVGLTNTTLIFSAALIAVGIAQFRVRRYIPGIYWSAVVLISVVGTLLTDNLTDGHNVPLWISTTVSPGCSSSSSVSGTHGNALCRSTRSSRHRVSRSTG